MPRARSLLLVLAVLVAMLLPAASASALSYPVTSTGDSDVEGTLRWSIEEAEATPGADSIPIEVTGTIELESALPTIEEGVEIVGPGAANLTVRRVSSSLFPVFRFAGTGNSSLAGVTVTGGSWALGGGISNGSGALALTRVAVVGNEATSGHILSTIAHGGGILSQGPLTLVESTVSGNHATAVEGTGETDAEGGGIFAFGKLAIDRSTVSGNVVESTPGGGTTFAMGGGIFAQGGGLVSGSTITGNSVIGGGSGSPGFTRGSNIGAPLALAVRDTIVSSPKGEAESCAGAEADSGGYNLDEDGSCGFDAGSDLNGVAAGLDPVLRDNGGPTPTHALLSGSLAIDRGNSFGATTDQRGLPRPSDFPSIGNKEGGDGSDIGAFELQAPPTDLPVPPPILVGSEPGDRTPPRTRIVSGPARVGFERNAKFRFASSEAQSSFRCKLDGKRWRKCRSPYELTVRPGKHLFRVRAIDRFGNADPTPARFGWRVKPVG
jgi:hypothetical protein